MLVPLHRFGNPFLTLEQLAQRILGKIIPGLSGAAEPQLRLVVVRQDAQTIPPAFAQLVSRYCEAGVPELFQCLDGLLLLRPGGVVIAEDIPGFPICIHHLPARLRSQDLFPFERFVIHLLILERNPAQPNLLRFPDDHILDRLEFLLLRQRQTLLGLVLVVVLQLITQLVPDLIALRHRREPGQLIHDGIHLSLGGFLQVAVYFFALGSLEHLRQSSQLVLNDRAVTATRLHLSYHITHCPLRRVAHLLIGQVLLLVEVQEFILKNIVGQFGAHRFDTMLRQITLPWISGPDHHVDVGVVLLVVKSGTPAELVGRYFHRLRQFRLMREEELAPAFSRVVPQSDRILPLERINERPDRSRMAAHFLHRVVEAGVLAVGEQAVRARTLRNVLQVLVAGVHQLNSVSGGDVLRVVSSAAAWLDVAALLDQSLHQSSLF